MRDWNDVLPKTEATRQTRWERNERIARAFAAGADVSDIAKGVGLKKERVLQILKDLSHQAPPILHFLRLSSCYSLMYRVERLKAEVSEKARRAEREARSATWRDRRAVLMTSRFPPTFPVDGEDIAYPE